MKTIAVFFVVTAVSVVVWSETPRGFFLCDDCTPVAIQFLNGEDLNKKCMEDPASVQGFVMGVSDLMVSDEMENYYQQTDYNTRAEFSELLDNATETWDLLDLPTPDYCPPYEVDARELTISVCSWLKKHPDQQKFAAADVVRKVLKAKYVCLESVELKFRIDQLRRTATKEIP